MHVLIKAKGAAEPGTKTKRGAARRPDAGASLAEMGVTERQSRKWIERLSTYLRAQAAEQTTEPAARLPMITCRACKNANFIPVAWFEPRSCSCSMPSPVLQSEPLPFTTAIVN
jgi:hypothetical protein